MQEITRVGILGAGALGALYASLITKAGGAEVYFIARGERRRRLAEQGLVVNGEPLHVPVHDAEGPAPEAAADLIIVALKHHHLSEALGDLAPVLGPETTIISVMNGLVSEEVLIDAYGPGRVLPCVALGMDAVREGKQVTFSRPGTLYIGEEDGSPSPRLDRVARAFDAFSVPYTVPPDMKRILWWKLMINVGMNQSSAVLGKPYGVFQESPAAQEIMESLMLEVVRLAEAAGVDLGEQDIADWYKVLNRLSPEGKTSMLQDIEAGRKTEVEVFGGSIVDMGERYGIPTPVNRTFLRMIQVLEATAAPA